MLELPSEQVKDRFSQNKVMVSSSQHSCMESSETQKFFILKIHMSMNIVMTANQMDFVAAH